VKSIFLILVSLFFTLGLQSNEIGNASGRDIPANNFNTSYVICSWNLKDFGFTKSDHILDFIAKTISGCDIVAIQEVVAGEGGVETVGRLYRKLNSKSDQWRYIVSAPTSGNSYKRERYSFFWKKDRVQLSDKPWLEKKYSLEIDREPYLATFLINGKAYTLVNYHAITQRMQPEKEIKYFKYFPNEYPGKKLLFMGDFNCPQTHTVFNPLKTMGYKAALTDEKTTLKINCHNKDCLASAFDQFFYKPDEFKVDSSWVFHFYRSFNSLEEARLVSDHLPIFIRIN